MAPILILALVGGALWYANKEAPKPVSSKPLDKGFTIITPCQQYDVYNEEASYKYVYNEYIKLLPEVKKLILDGNEEALSDKINEFQLNMFGCTKSKVNPAAVAPMYYAWVYRMLRAGMKAFVDKRTLIGKNLKKEDVISISDQILHNYLEFLKAQGLDIEGLPTTVEGDFLQ